MSFALTLATLNNADTLSQTNQTNIMENDTDIASLQGGIDFSGDHISFDDEAAFNADTTTIWHIGDTAVIGAAGSEIVYFNFGADGVTNTGASFLADNFAQINGLTTIDLADVGTVSLGSETAGQLLRYDGTNWQNFSVNVHNLANVNDSAPGSAEDGYSLTWNNTAGEWQATAASVGDFQVGQLSNVSGNTPTGDNLLQYDTTASEWQPQTVATVLGAGDLQNLGDVTTDSPSAGQYLSWDGTDTWELTSPPSAVTLQADAPSSPSEGDLWYDTDGDGENIASQLYIYTVVGNDGTNDILNWVVTTPAPSLPSAPTDAGTYNLVLDEDNDYTWTTVSSEVDLSGFATESTIATDDEIVFTDTSASEAGKKITVANLASTLTGQSNLVDLGDVDADDTVADGDLLQYDSTDSEWKFVSLSLNQTYYDAAVSAVSATSPHTIALSGFEVINSSTDATAFETFRELYYNGLRLIEGTNFDFTISGTTLTLSDDAYDVMDVTNGQLLLVQRTVELS